MPIEFGTADDCLFEFGHLQAGETVLIQAGAGGVGLAAIQLAKRGRRHRAGHRVERRPLARLAELGLDHGINYADDRRRRARCAASPTAGASTSSSTRSAAARSRRSIACLAYRGRVSWVGNAGRESSRRSTIWPIMQKQRLAHRRVPRRRDGHRSPERTHAMIAGLLDRVAAGELQVVDRPHLPAGRGRRGPPLHREPPGLRPRRADPLIRRFPQRAPMTGQA